MKEEYEIIFIAEEGRAIINKKTKKVYHSEFEIIEEKDKEIDRLNNIINELEEYLEKQQREQSEYCDFFIKDKQIEVQEVLDKLKELKEE